MSVGSGPGYRADTDTNPSLDSHWTPKRTPDIPTQISNQKPVPRLTLTLSRPPGPNPTLLSSQSLVLAPSRTPVRTQLTPVLVPSWSRFLLEPQRRDISGTSPDPVYLVSRGKVVSGWESGRDLKGRSPSPTPKNQKGFLLTTVKEKSWTPQRDGPGTTLYLWSAPKGKDERRRSRTDP